MDGKKIYEKLDAKTGRSEDGWKYLFVYDSDSIRTIVYTDSIRTKVFKSGKSSIYHKQQFIAII